MLDGLCSRSARAACPFSLAKGEFLGIDGNIARDIAHPNRARLDRVALFADDGQPVLIFDIRLPRFALIVRDIAQTAQAVIGFNIAYRVAIIHAAEIRSIRRGQVEHQIILVGQSHHVAHQIQNGKPNARQPFFRRHIGIRILREQNQPLVADEYAVNIFIASLRNAGKGEDRRIIRPYTRLIAVRGHLKRHARRRRRFCRGLRRCICRRGRFRRGLRRLVCRRGRFRRGLRRFVCRRGRFRRGLRRCFRRRRRCIADIRLIRAFPRHIDHD